MSMQTLTVGLMADSGLPENVAQTLTDTLAKDLSRVIDGGTQWRVETSEQSLPLTADGEIPLLKHAQSLRETNGWDYLVYLTDLPRFHNAEPMVCELSSAARAGLVSLPTLGAWRVGSRAHRLLVRLISLLTTGSEQPHAVPPARPTVPGGPAWATSRAGPGDLSYLTNRSRWARPRLLAGMVRNNRPGRLLGALSTCVATAVATGAFGIFYASIWNMADALAPARLAAISLVGIVTLSVWLIFHNNLWSRVGSRSSKHQQLWLDNAATILTVGLSVVLVYLVLYAVLLAGALTIITGGYLEAQLGHPVTIVDYLRLTWLAASLGIMAGALGSNFDSDHAIREATYSRRAHQRRQLAQNYED